MGDQDLFHHVRDFPYFELPGGSHLQLPEIAGLQLTKFMVLQVVAGLLTLFIFRGLARRVRNGEPTSGFWNFWETIAIFLRDDVVRPTIGTHEHTAHDLLPQDDELDEVPGDSPHLPAHDDSHGAHPADQYLPFVWTCFFYILFCNLLGAIPMLGSATGNLAVTLALALVAFGATFYYGAREMGPVGFFKNLVPSIDAGVLNVFILPMMFVIEFVGLIIKHGVLAVRLFANIMGGHTVLGVMLGFIALPAVAGSGLYYIVAPASVLGQVFIGLLELFVAFLQAYVFAFLSTIFIATAIHEH